MKKKIGGKLALYPTPVVVIGAEVMENVTWTLVAHIGIVAHDRLLISLHASHFINKGIKETKRMSVNIVTEDWLAKADYCGVVSGNKTDKSELFVYTKGEIGTPMIDESPLTMECVVEDIYECNGFENFICSVAGTYASPDVLDSEGDSLSYALLKPILFEYPTYQYLRTGDIIGNCAELGKEYRKRINK